jgi:hypothetical protein
VGDQPKCRRAFRLISHIHASKSTPTLSKFANHLVKTSRSAASDFFVVELARRGHGGTVVRLLKIIEVEGKEDEKVSTDASPTVAQSLTGRPSPCDWFAKYFDAASVVATLRTSRMATACRSVTVRR